MVSLSWCRHTSCSVYPLTVIRCRKVPSEMATAWFLLLLVYATGSRRISCVTHTHLLRRLIEVWCGKQRSCKNNSPKNTMRWPIIRYIYIITGDNDNIKQQQLILCPPQLRLKCAQGRDYIIYAGTECASTLPSGWIPQLRWHGQGNSCHARCSEKKFYIHIDGSHRHPAAAGLVRWRWRWDDNEN
jgi:hypothetical protein